MAKKQKDLVKINEAYFKKYEEFSKMTLEELKELYEVSSKDKKKRIGGIHRTAFLDVVSSKLQNQSIREAIKDESKEIINQETIIEEPVQGTNNGFILVPNYV